MYAAPEPLISNDFSGWWSKGVAVARTGWRPLAILQVGGALLGFVFTAVLGVIQLRAVSDIVTNRAPGAPPPTAGEVLGPLLRLYGFTLAGGAVAGFVSLLVTLMSVHIVVQVAGGRHPDLGGAFRAALPRILPLLGWSLLSGLILLAGLCACVLPGLYFLAVFTVLAPVVMVERVNVIGRCFKLFHGNLGASLGRVATIIGLGIAVGLVSAVVDSVLSAVAGGTSAGMGARVTVVLIGGLIGALLQAGLGILTAPLTVLTYADQRARIEPINSATIVRELGLDTP